MTLDAYLAARPDRCRNGHAYSLHPQACQCGEAGTSEWQIFVHALRRARRADGSIHQCDVRPLIAGRIPPKRIGQLWRRARNDGLIADTGEREPSNDAKGRNTDKLDRIYRWEAAA